MFVDIVLFVDVANDADLWFVFEEPIDESVQIGVPEVAVEYSNGYIKVQRGYQRTVCIPVFKRYIQTSDGATGNQNMPDSCQKRRAR